MIRNFVLGSLGLAGVLSLSSPGQAEVVVRAPFVCVRIGPGVQVQAAGVNVFVPAGAPATQPFVQPVPGQPPVGPAPRPLPGAGDPDAPPVPTPIRAMTLREFADNFRAGPGNFEAVLVNPVTCQPCVVHFCLPGCPRRVSVHRCEIVYHYGIGRWVRISFDSHGYVVTSRKV